MYDIPMDIPWMYIWGKSVKHLSKREIEKMKKNMKKVPIIQIKSDVYHDKEILEAEKLLSKIHNTSL